MITVIRCYLKKDHIFNYQHKNFYVWKLYRQLIITLTITTLLMSTKPLTTTTRRIQNRWRTRHKSTKSMLFILEIWTFVWKIKFQYAPQFGQIYKIETAQFIRYFICILAQPQGHSKTSISCNYGTKPEIA